QLQPAEGRNREGQERFVRGIGKADGAAGGEQSPVDSRQALLISNTGFVRLPQRNNRCSYRECSRLVFSVLNSGEALASGSRCNSVKALVYHYGTRDSWGTVGDDSAHRESLSRQHCRRLVLHSDQSRPRREYITAVFNDRHQFAEPRMAWIWTISRHRIYLAH